MQRPTKRTVNVESLISRDDVNVREPNNYDIPAMAEGIVQARRIMTPIIAEETQEGLIVLSGNRRTRGGQYLLADPQRITAILLAIADGERDAQKKDSLKKTLATDTEAIVENLKKTEVVVHKGLDTEERLILILDHGGIKPISRTEVVKTCWRMNREICFSEADIIRVCYSSLASYTGNIRKLAELPSVPKEREVALRKWFHGTVGNYILAAQKMGDYIQEQFILTHRAEDMLLLEGEKVELKCSRDRITQLSAAKNKDKEVWSPETGGPEFNALVSKFKAEDAGLTDKVEKKRPTVKELIEKADLFKSPCLRKAFLLAAGETGDKVSGLVDDDDRMYRSDKAMDILSARWEKLPAELKDFAKHVLDDSPAKLAVYLDSLTTVTAAS